MHRIFKKFIPSKNWAQNTKNLTKWTAAVIFTVLLNEYYIQDVKFRCHYFWLRPTGKEYTPCPSIHVILVNHKDEK